jgi:DNA-directed RNA polymerase subunit M/transcription elongation factor TFIIS
MHFCSECHNMYYLKISSEDANSLIYYCRNCGNENDTLTADNICVSNVELKRSEQKYTHIINEFTKYDNTLPRTNTIKCPNPNCISNKSGNEDKREVIYIRYDDLAMKYIYACAQCDKMWKTNESK